MRPAASLAQPGGLGQVLSHVTLYLEGGGGMGEGGAEMGGGAGTGEKGARVRDRRGRGRNERVINGTMLPIEVTSAQISGILVYWQNLLSSHEHSPADQGSSPGQE